MQFNKRENMNVFTVSKLLVWRQNWVAHVRQPALRSRSPVCRQVGKYLCNLQKKYAVPAAGQIKLRMRELSTKRCQSNFSTVYIFG